MLYFAEFFNRIGHERPFREFAVIAGADPQSAAAESDRRPTSRRRAARSPVRRAGPPAMRARIAQGGISNAGTKIAATSASNQAPAR